MRRHRGSRKVLAWLVVAVLVAFLGSRIVSRPAISHLSPKIPPNSAGTVHKTAPRPQPLPASVLLKVPPESQNPELPNGCEVTSLSMLLSAVGHPVGKMQLSRMVAYDPTPRVLGANGQVVSWGNPNVGFVGSMTVLPDGFGVYHGPITNLLNQILPGRAVDMTGRPFEDILRQVADGIPVELWVTTTLKPTTLWVTWQSPEGPVHTTFDEHAVLLVGYDQTDLYINNPLNGEAGQKVPRKDLLGAWVQMGRQAVSVSPATSP